MNTLEQFKNAMLEAGITPPITIIGDGVLHRFKINGKLNGAYKLHLDGRPAGYFQDWRGIKQTWKMSSGFVPLSEFQRQAYQARRREDEIKRKAEEIAKHEAAAKKARSIWNNAALASENQTYLLKKRIKPHGARLGRDNALIIPVVNAKKELVNLQFISETGGKRFLAGGKKKGCFYYIGDNTNKILIAEGFATGASLHEDTGFLTVIAFDAGNLKEVAIVLKSLYQDAEIIVCGDNDASGVGQKKAREAALACSGKILIPEVSGCDWNDVINMEVSV